MAQSAVSPTAQALVGGDPLYCVFHPSFEEADAADLYRPQVVLDQALEQAALPYMPDEATRDAARRMHYAAYRYGKATRPADARRWKWFYYGLRDRIVVGNRKLVYRAARKPLAFAHRADDMIGEGHIVLIRAVAAYNPWLGIRFSTYAFTCLMRALSRLTQRFAKDWLSASLLLDSLPDTHLSEALEDDEPSPWVEKLGEFLAKEHPLLSDREKTILARRFRLEQRSETQTLDQVGQDLGLSKERVRQLQAIALGKLRQALLATPHDSKAWPAACGQDGA